MSAVTSNQKSVNWNNVTVCAFKNARGSFKGFSRFGSRVIARGSTLDLAIIKLPLSNTVVLDVALRFMDLRGLSISCGGFFGRVCTALSI